MGTTGKTLAAVAALLFALTTQAGEAGSRNDGSRPIRLTQTAVMLGVTISPGSYSLLWAREPGSENVRVEITQGRDVLAVGKGRWVESAQPSPYESLVYHEGRERSELTEIRFKRSADAIRIDNGTTRADAQPAKASDKDGARVIGPGGRWE